MIDILPMGRGLGVCTAGLVFVTATCGGLAVLDGPGDETGNGGNSASSSSRTGSSTTQGPVSVVSSSTGGLDCTTVCDDLWGCTQRGDLCPGLEPGDEAQFKQDCLDMCNGPTGPALAGLIDPTDCPETIDIISSVSADFAAACEGTDGGG